MTKDTKIFQSLLDGQVLIRKDISEVKAEVKKTEERLTGRIDKLGLQLANLEDDAPTIEEFDKLEQTVVKIQKHLALSDS